MRAKLEMAIELVEHEQGDDVSFRALFGLIFDLKNIPLTVALIQRYAAASKPCVQLLTNSVLSLAATSTTTEELNNTCGITVCVLRGGSNAS